jgi:DNA-binding MarR family transcriptional regulator
LTPTQGQILTLLQEKNGVPARLTEVAEGLAITAATASDTVTALVEKQLVKKTKAPDDARAVAIALTEKGEREAANATAWPDFLLNATQDLSLTEQENVLRGLIKIVRSLQERGEIPVPRMCVTCRFFHPNVYADSDRPHHCAFVDAPFGDRHLRLDCPEHEMADSESRERTWHRFTQGNQ